MKNTKMPQEKKVSFFKKIFGRSKSKREIAINNLLDDMDAESFAKAYNEELFGESASENTVPFENTSVDFEKEYGVSVSKPIRIIQKDAVFTKGIKPVHYLDELSAYLLDHGLSVEKSSLREFFAGLATSKLIVVENPQRIISERFIELFSTFIGAHYYSEDLSKETNDFSDLLTKGRSFREAIVHANTHKNRIHITSFKDLVYDSFVQYFEKGIDFALNPHVECNIETEDFKDLPFMPNNIWFLVLADKASEGKKSPALLESSITVSIKAKLVDSKDEVEENSIKLSYEYFTNLLLDAYEDFYIKEEEWKKLDRIEASLHEQTGFTIDNRIFRQLERYTSTFLLFGGDQEEAIDCVFFSKFLPLIKDLKLHSNQDSDEGVFQQFELEFGLENLSRSKTVLKEIQEANRIQSKK